MKKTIDELLQTEYWIIDILPVQVPKDSPGQYFAVERYFLRRPHIRAIKQKHINVILKLNCYRDFSLDEEASLEDDFTLEEEASLEDDFTLDEETTLEDETGSS